MKKKRSRNFEVSVFIRYAITVTVKTFTTTQIILFVNSERTKYIADKATTMGTPITPPVEPDPEPVGDPCNQCWGAGKPFGDGDTPASINVNFSGLQSGISQVIENGPNEDGSWTLPQKIGVPCVFEIPLFGGFGIDVLFQFGQTGVVADAFFSTIFFGFTESPCSTLIFQSFPFGSLPGSCKILIPEVQ